jgi:D-alanyl-D-alanine carboxypeptidase
MRRALVAVLAAVVAGCGGSDSGTPTGGRSGTATGFDRDLGTRLQRTLDEDRRTYGIPGASAAVIVSGKGLWAGASGRVSRGGAPVTADTAFNVGSVTKTFVAALVLELADEGVLRLDDPLARWLPAYPRAERMTVRQLLNHTSGLADFVRNPAFREAALRRSPKLATVEGVLSFTPAPIFEPGDRFAYSNAGYLLLGRVVERATSSTVGRELMRRLLDPLGLRSVVYAPEQALPARFSHGYVDVDGDGTSEDVLPLAGIRPGRPTSWFGWADGGVVATARDLARWGHALYGGKVLAAAQLEQMLRFVEQGSVDYGLGVERARISGHLAWGHTGNNIGYRAELRHFPRAGVTIAVVWNDSRLEADLLLQGLASAVLEESEPAG